MQCDKDGTTRLEQWILRILLELRHEGWSRPHPLNLYRQSQFISYSASNGSTAFVPSSRIHSPCWHQSSESFAPGRAVMAHPQGLSEPATQKEAALQIDAIYIQMFPWPNGPFQNSRRPSKVNRPHRALGFGNCPNPIARLPTVQTVWKVPCIERFTGRFPKRFEKDSKLNDLQFKRFELQFTYQIVIFSLLYWIELFIVAL